MEKLRQDEEFIAGAYRLFDEFYRAGEAYRETCRENERYWCSSQWQGTGEEGEPRPVTPVLFSTLESVLADLMDNYPEAVLLGEEPGDDDAAERLSKLVKYVLSHRGYRRTYREKCRSALVKGTSVQEVYWDGDLCGGLGDVNVREWNIENFCWDPLFADIQEGRACFKFGFFPRSWYEVRYPALAPLMREDAYSRPEAPERFTRDGEAEIMLVEYWWREYLPEENRHRVHMCKLAGGVLLEDSRIAQPEGVYAHGMYPFIVEPLYPLPGQAVGRGMVDTLKSLQRYADRLDQIILKNALMSGHAKMLVSRGADLDEQGLLDGEAELVRGGRIDEGAVRWMQVAPLAGYIPTYQQLKLAAIKEESGQNQLSRGEAAGGITAASAILAMQEAGSKRSRLIIEQLYDGFALLVRMLVEVIEENYTERRIFRLDGGERGLLSYGGERVMDFDVSVRVQQQTPYTTLYQNELALQLLRAGLISADSALGMMSFEGKEQVVAERRRDQQKLAGKGGENE